MQEYHFYYIMKFHLAFPMKPVASKVFPYYKNSSTPLECCYSYCLKGLEPEGAWKRAGGTFQPEAAFAAAKVESHHRHRFVGL